jgi:predicted SnoaL-like aldol condensation-catalyzing enzyme
MVAAFATGALGDVATYVHEDYLDHQGLDGQRPITGIDGFAHVVRVARAAMSGLEVEIVDLIEDGDRAVARIAWRGRRPSGEPVDRATIDIVRIADARAVEHWGAEV